MSEIQRPKDSIDDLISGMSLTAGDLRKPERKGITIWLADDYKAKYARLQKRTGGQFHRVLKEILARAIDSVQEDAS